MYWPACVYYKQNWPDSKRGRYRVISGQIILPLGLHLWPCTNKPSMRGTGPGWPACPDEAGLLFCSHVLTLVAELHFSDLCFSRLWEEVVELLPGLTSWCLSLWEQSGHCSVGRHTLAAASCFVSSQIHREGNNSEATFTLLYLPDLQSPPEWSVTPFLRFHLPCPVWEIEPNICGLDWSKRSLWVITICQYFTSN